MLAPRDADVTWRSRYVATYMGWELAAHWRGPDRPAVVFGSLYSPFGTSPDSVCCFEVGSSEPRFYLHGPDDE